MKRRIVVEKARKALAKPAAHGPDIDISIYLARERPLHEGDRELAKQTLGLDLSKSRVSAMYYQINERIEVLNSVSPCIDIVPIESVEENEFVWKAIPPDLDKYVAAVALYGHGGFFVRVKKGCRVELPIQTCFFMTGGAQLVHNVVVVEDGAEAVVVTGCTIMPEAIGFHAAVTEIYLGRNAKLVDVMIHSWNNVTHVRPRTAVILSEGSTYVSYYINMSKTRTIQSLPSIVLEGDGSRCYSASVILGLDEGYYDIGAHAVLKGKESSAELVSKIVARDSSKIVSRLRIDAKGDKSRGFAECSALMLSESANVTTIPELISSIDSAEVYHEASIGKLRGEELEYLLLKGFSEQEAIALLVRSFVEVKLDLLPFSIRKALDNVLNLLARRSSY